MLGLSLNPEARPHKIAAVFEQHTAAKAAHHTLIDYGHFDKKDVDIIAPDDGEAREKIEPEPEAIGHTLIVSHFILGAVGAAIGIAAALLMVSSGPLFAQSSPVLTVFALGFIGMFFGLFAAGLLSLRPDHDPLINETLAAIRQNKWAVIVQAKDSGDQQRARQLLQPVAVSVTDTF
jgi:hypothetical protein